MIDIKFPGQQDSVFPTADDLHGMKQASFDYYGHRVDVLNPKKASRKHLIYLHGGGYYCGYGLRHWRMISYIGSEANVTVHCLDYPLIPSTCDETIEYVIRYYLELLQVSSNEDIFFIGDSAGAGLSIASIMTLRDQGLPLPRYNFMFSPYVDVTFSNPKIPTDNPHDETLYKVGKVYAGTRDMKDYRVSPLYGNTNDLSPTLFITNDGDRLHYDVLLMVEKFKESNTPYELMFYEGLYHDFILDLYHDESEEVHRRIIAIIKE